MLKLKSFWEKKQKNKGKSYTAEQLIDSMDKDITVFDRWIDSMADSRDPRLNIYG